MDGSYAKYLKYTAILKVQENARCADTTMLHIAMMIVRSEGDNFTELLNQYL